ncbi:MAG: glycosyltransferase [Deltaproteobacteria bacterium]|nr:glycosyltransferase [Deltaproteobacteria bacterium]
MNTCSIVIPCYNEAARMNARSYLDLLVHPDVKIILVDDGSTDDTWLCFEAIVRNAPANRVKLLRMDKNVGKGEAVRAGLNLAIKENSDVVGYLDADLATPASELLRMYEQLNTCDALVLLGSRVKLLGYEISRSVLRHYLGRLFATLASLLLNLPVYDTQCGAKLFLVTPILVRALSQSFHSKWAFDVELLGRLHRSLLAVGSFNSKSFCEVPLHIWRDMGGSKVKPLAAIKATAELFLIAWKLRQYCKLI